MITYNPVIPQAADLPSDSQSDINSNFFSLNTTYGQDHIPFGNSIENATSEAPIVITSPIHRLTTGNQVTVFNMEGINSNEVRIDWPINDDTFLVTVIDENTFSLDGSDGSDEILFPPYLENSGDFNSLDLPYGQHLKNFFPTPLTEPPNRISPKTAYFPMEMLNLSQLFFQNGDMEENITQLTGLSPIVSNHRGTGWKTPWGLIINMGKRKLNGDVQTFAFPVPFTVLPISLMITRDALEEAGSGTRNPAGRIINLTQFNARIERSGNTAIAGCHFLAIGI